MVSSLICRIIVSGLTFICFYGLVANGGIAFLIIGLIVATILAFKQYELHLSSGYIPWLYSLIFIVDMLLWQSAVYISVREAYANREIS